MSEIYEVEDAYSYDRGYDWCRHCETCGDDEIEPHEYFDASSDLECFVCHNRKCMYSFSVCDLGREEEWCCPECNSPHIMKHERCQCDEPTCSGTVYQVHDEDGNANCWPTYHHNANKRVFECTRCRGQFDIGINDTTEDTEKRKATRCPSCNCKQLNVKNVKCGDMIPDKKVVWYDD